MTEPGVLWQTNVGGTIGNPAVVANGMVYVPSGGPDGLVALDANSGGEVWHVAGTGGAPAVAGGVVVVRNGTVQSTPNDLLALDAATGARLWSHAQTQDAGWTPVIDRGVVYLPALPRWDSLPPGLPAGIRRFRAGFSGRRTPAPNCPGCR